MGSDEVCTLEGGPEMLRHLFLYLFCSTITQKEKYRYLVTPWIVNKENQNKHKEMWTGCVTF